MRDITEDRDTPSRTDTSAGLNLSWADRTSAPQHLPIAAARAPFPRLRRGALPGRQRQVLRWQLLGGAGLPPGPHADSLTTLFRRRAPCPLVLPAAPVVLQPAVVASAAGVIAKRTPVLAKLPAGLGDSADVGLMRNPVRVSTIVAPAAQVAVRIYRPVPRVARL